MSEWVQNRHGWILEVRKPVLSECCVRWYKDRWLATTAVYDAPPLPGPERHFRGSRDFCSLEALEEAKTWCERTRETLVAILEADK